MIKPRTPFALLLALALWPAGLFAQSTGVISGRATDPGTGAPIPEVRVMVRGTTLGAVTDAQGQYTIRGVPPGPHEVQATSIGREPGSQQVTVAAGAVATANFQLAQTALTLEGLVVTATGERQRAREVGVAVGKIDVEDEVEMAAVQDVADVLQGRTAGVSVLQASGATGTGSRIRIRGSNSISLNNDPLLIIDGVRAENSNPAFIDVGGQNISRLEDLNPENIETIEVLKGPAASALYGTAAANGVIVITTKKGRAGETRFNAYTEQGTVSDATAYPANYLGYCTIPGAGEDGGDEVFGFCDIGTLSDPGLVSLGIRQDSLVSFNPLEDPRSTPFETGRRYKYGVNVAGGSEFATYYLAADIEDENGLYKYDLSDLDRKNLRANLRAQLASDLDVTVSSGYINSVFRLPQNDNNALGVVAGALLSNEVHFDPATAGYGFGITPRQIANIDTRSAAERIIGSASANYQPLTWLALTGTAGFDRVNSFDTETVLPGQVPYSPTYLEGYRESDRVQNSNYTANANATATYGLSAGTTGSTSAGIQYSEEILRSTEAFGAVLLAGVPSLEGANARFAVDEDNTQVRTIGAYLQQQVALNDRIFLTGAIRGDDNSAFGQDFGLALYPSVTASWVVAEEPWFPQLSFLSSLRLRSAYGRSGLRPDPLDAIRFFSPVAVTDPLSGVSIPGFTVGGAGNVNLKPEISTEVEFGFDAGFFDDRVGTELTYYDKKSENALVFRPLPPSLGVSEGRRENLGSVRNSGLEFLLNARLLDARNLRWNATLSASRLRNELTDIGRDPVTGEPLPPIIFGLGGDSQRHTVGRPLGAYFALPYEYSDANGDGIIGVDEVEITSDTAVFVGNPFPTREASLSTDVTLFRNVKLSGMLDYRGGYKLFNSTEEFRCGSFFNCRAIYDADAPLAAQAAAIGTAYYATPYGYMEDATFVKLRELSLTLTVPQTFARRFGTDRLSLTLSGRNLATWTDYTGLDPEINFAGSGSNFSTAEFLTQPPARFFTARVDVGF